MVSTKCTHNHDLRNSTNAKSLDYEKGSRSRPLIQKAKGVASLKCERPIINVVLPYLIVTYVTLRLPPCL